MTSSKKYSSAKLYLLSSSVAESKENDSALSIATVDEKTDVQCQAIDAAFNGFILQLQKMNQKLKEECVQKNNQQLMIENLKVHKWPWICTATKKEPMIITNMTVIAKVRINQDFSQNKRCGIILGNHPKEPYINFEVHSAGRPRVLWGNEDESYHDIMGKTNLIDGKIHVLAFVRECMNINGLNMHKISIFVDGKLDVAVTRKAKEEIILKNRFYLGQDHNVFPLAFNGDILRCNGWSIAMDAEQVQAITQSWLK